MKYQTVLLAQKFQKSLYKNAYETPTSENVKPIIISTVERLRKNKPEVFDGVVKVAEYLTVDTNQENDCYVYFILDVTPDKYQELTANPSAKSERDTLIQNHLIFELSQKFQGFNFRIKIGYVAS